MRRQSDSQIIKQHASQRYADACRQHYLDCVERNFEIFSPHIVLDANSVVEWIPFGKVEFDKICKDAAHQVPQFDRVRNILVPRLNKWIDMCKMKFSRQCVLEAKYGASPVFALEMIRRQTNSSVVKSVMGHGIYRQFILQYLSVSPVRHAVEILPVSGP